jgi:hypothetical protein
VSIELPLRVLPGFAAVDGSVCAGVDAALLLPKLQTNKHLYNTRHMPRRF